MLVKARWNIKDASGWHLAGEVFQTEAELGDAVIVLEKPADKKQEKQAEPEVPAEVKEEASKPKTASRRKKVSE